MHIQKSITLNRPVSIFLFLLILVPFITVKSSFAEDSGYYKVSDGGRPRGVYSVCCCSEDSKDDKQITYTCKFHEGEICPFNAKPYKAGAFDCPSSLTVSRYTPDTQN